MARTWLTLIFFQLTVKSHPACLTLTTVPVLLFNTFSVHTRLGGTVVRPRQAQRAVGAGWAQALEPVHLVHASSPAHTRVRVALIDLHITFKSCVSWGAHTLVLVNAILAVSVLTGVARTVILIDLTVQSCGSRGAVTLVGVDQVYAAPSVLTGVAVALPHLDITDGARVSRVALTGEGGDAVFTDAVVARLWYAVIDVLLTK